MKNAWWADFQLSRTRQLTGVICIGKAHYHHSKSWYSCTCRCQYKDVGMKLFK